MNKVILSGNIVSDFKFEELKDNNNIRKACKFKLEVKTYNVKENYIESDIIDVIALDTKASILSNTVAKGDKISISGKLKVDKLSTVNIIVDGFSVVNSILEEKSEVS